MHIWGEKGTDKKGLVQDKLTDVALQIAMKLVVVSKGFTRIVTGGR